MVGYLLWNGNSVADPLHSRQSPTNGGIHVPYAYLYANAAARTGATGFIAADVGKLALQSDNNSLWMLTAITPTWNELQTGSSSGDVVGPGSATNNAAVRFDTASGKLIQDSLVDIDDSGNIDNAEGMFNGVRYYESTATDPVSPVPADGDRYWNTSLEMEMRYDGSRSKWLSVAMASFCFSRDSTSAGSYFRTGETTMTSTRGYNMPYNGTIVAMGLTRGSTTTATIEATAAGVQIATLVMGTATKAKSNTLNADIAADAVLGARNLSGGNQVDTAIGYIAVRWRV